MRIIALLVLFIAANASINAQDTLQVKTEYDVSASLKYGWETMPAEGTLTVIYDDQKLKFNTREGQAWSEFTVKKKTDKYVICNSDLLEGYGFLDIENVCFFYIDFFLGRYTARGVGKPSDLLKTTPRDMMKMLKDGKSQKDVMQHLIDQTDYDF